MPPIAVMMMSVSVFANRAVEHVALLGAERLIERFERRLRRLQGVRMGGRHLAEMRVSLHDGGARV
jgi:hypothetical protein